MPDPLVGRVRALAWLQTVGSVRGRQLKTQTDCMLYFLELFLTPVRVDCNHSGLIIVGRFNFSVVSLCQMQITLMTMP